MEEVNFDYNALTSDIFSSLPGIINSFTDKGGEGQTIIYQTLPQEDDIDYTPWIIAGVMFLILMIFLIIYITKK